MFNLVEHLRRQRAWSMETFGPGQRRQGVVDHIRRELVEIEKAPCHDISEWIDVLILAFDGAMRDGATPYRIINELVAKQTINELRKWPDWRSQSPDKAIEHIRT